MSEHDEGVLMDVARTIGSTLGTVAAKTSQLVSSVPAKKQIVAKVRKLGARAKRSARKVKTKVKAKAGAKAAKKSSRKSTSKAKGKAKPKARGR
jgi:hypothetical protein